MAQLTLARPLVVFDLETTGPDPARDRIVQFAAIRVTPEGARETFETLVNPGVPIPPDATRVHGIGDADVAGAPPLRELAPRIAALFDGADIGGFNSVRFDLPLLVADLGRAGVAFEAGGRGHVDAMKIFHLRERRDLAAAVRFYCDRDHAGAHSALADAEATLAVLEAQLDRYPDLPRDVPALHRVCNPDEARFADATGKFAFNDQGEVYVTFGKHRNVLLRTLVAETPAYLQWMINADFPEDAKQIARAALRREFPRR